MRQNRAVLILFTLLMLLSSLVGAQPAQKPTDNFTFVVLGDSRGRDEGINSKILSKMVEEIAKINPAFVIHTGDVVSGTTDTKVLAQQFAAFKKAIAPLKMPFYVTPGNHEIRGSVDNETLFRRTFGAPYQSFDYGNSHFILLSSEIPDESNRITGKQMDWFKKDIKRGYKAAHRFVFLHSPLFPVGPHIGSSLDQYRQNRDELFDLLKRYQVEYAFVGHEHLYNRSNHDGVIQIITGGAGAPLYSTESSGGFFHYLVVHVKGKEIKTDLVKVKVK